MKISYLSLGVYTSVGATTAGDLDRLFQYPGKYIFNFGLDGVILLGDCVDLWAPKTLRSAMGSAFRVPVYRMESAAELKLHLAALNVPMYAAALYADSQSLCKVDLRRACVVIGNEAHGVSQETLNACDGSLIIPIRTAESLNAAVAASVFAWEMSRQNQEGQA